MGKDLSRGYKKVRIKPNELVVNANLILGFLISNKCFEKMRGKEWYHENGCIYSSDDSYYISMYLSFNVLVFHVGTLRTS